MSSSSTHAPTKLKITVIYDGRERTVVAEDHEVLQALLNAAMNAFDIHQNRHTLALWTEAGSELTDLNAHLSDVGIVTGARLLLRPSQVRGGGRP
jgi:hypothetical protein